MKKNILNLQDPMYLFHVPIIFIMGILIFYKKASRYGNVIVGLMSDKAITTYKANKSFLNFNRKKSFKVLNMLKVF